MEKPPFERYSCMGSEQDAWESGDVPERGEDRGRESVLNSSLVKLATM
jgi:hypothetical protein